MNRLLLMLKKKLLTAALWQAIAVAALVAIPITNHFTLVSAMGQMRFTAMDATNTYLMTNVGSFETAEGIHAEIARMTAHTIFDRSPENLENKDRVDRLFDSTPTKDNPNGIAGYLITKTNQDSDVFKMGQWHQNIETGRITELRTSPDSAVVRVEGQVFRHGFMNDRKVDDCRNVTLIVKVKVNPHMDTNGMFPVIVENYEARF